MKPTCSTLLAVAHACHKWIPRAHPSCDTMKFMGCLLISTWWKIPSPRGPHRGLALLRLRTQSSAQVCADPTWEADALRTLWASMMLFTRESRWRQQLHRLEQHSVHKQQKTAQGVPQLKWHANGWREWIKTKFNHTLMMKSSNTN